MYRRLVLFGSARPGPPHFSLGGIPVRVEPSFWLIVLLLGFTPRTTPTLLAGWVAIVFVSVLVHELGHAVAFRAFGSEPTIVLHGFGGLTYGRPVRGRWRSIVVSLAGPLSALVLLGVPAAAAFLSGWAGDQSDTVHQLVVMAAWVNVGWSVLNLIPLLPLDGGHVCEQLVGGRGARIVTIALAIPLVVLGLRAGFVFGAFLAGFLAVRAFQELQAGSHAEARINVIKSPRRPAAPAPLATHGDPWELLAIGDVASARHLAGPEPPDPWLAGALDVAAGSTSRGLRTLEAAFLDGPPPNPTVATVLAEAELGPRMAERMLERDDDRAPDAVVDLVRALLAAGRPGQAALA
ncbi:MAG: site-2 protease family protein, partial [Acidimicrobiales bacterium]